MEQCPCFFSDVCVCVWNSAIILHSISILPSFTEKLYLFLIKINTVEFELRIEKLVLVIQMRALRHLYVYFDQQAIMLISNKGQFLSIYINLGKHFAFDVI